MEVIRLFRIYYTPSIQCSSQPSLKRMSPKRKKKLTFQQPTNVFRPHRYALRITIHRVSQTSILSIPTRKQFDRRDTRAVDALDGEEREVTACVEVYAFCLGVSGGGAPEDDFGGDVDGVEGDAAA